MKKAKKLILSLAVCLAVLLGALGITAYYMLIPTVTFDFSSQGQLSAVGTIVSSCYGFICGAYMPISSFSNGIKNALSFFPGAYGTSLLRNHALRGALEEVAAQGYPQAVVGALKDTADCNFYFFENQVQTWQMYLVLLGTTALLVGGFLLLYTLKSRKNNQKKSQNKAKSK